jgi:hypothetical protein
VVDDLHPAPVGEKVVDQDEIDRALLAQGETVENGIGGQKCDVGLIDRGAGGADELELDRIVIYGKYGVRHDCFRCKV